VQHDGSGFEQHEAVFLEDRHLAYSVEKLDVCEADRTLIAY
jgi:hypothetical protein